MLETNAGKFYRQLETNLRKHGVTEDGAKVIAQSTVSIEPGDPITKERLDKIAKELKLSKGEVASFQFSLMTKQLGSFVLDALKTKHVADSVKSLIETAKENPEVAEALNDFYEGFAGDFAKTHNTGTEIDYCYYYSPGISAEKTKAGGVQIWLADDDEVDPTDLLEFKIKSGRQVLATVARDEDGAWSIYPRRGAENYVKDLSHASLQTLHSALHAEDDEGPIAKKGRSSLKRVVTNAIRKMNRGAASYYGTGASSNALDENRYSAVARAKEPEVAAKKKHADDPGAFVFDKDADTWVFKAAKNGKLDAKQPGTPIEDLGVMTLNEVRLALQSYTDAGDPVLVQSQKDGGVHSETVQLYEAVGKTLAQKSNDRLEDLNRAEQHLRQTLGALRVEHANRAIIDALVESLGLSS